MSITTLVLIVLGVIVLVVVAIGVTQGFDSVFGWLPGFIPQDLEKTTQACNIYAQQDLTTSYCKEFKEIKTPSKVKTYVNCEFSEIQEQLTKKLNCDSNEALTFCLSLAQDSSFSEKKVNGKVCKKVSNPDGVELDGQRYDTTCEGNVFKGTWINKLKADGSPNSCSNPEDGNQYISDITSKVSNKDTNPTKICCKLTR